MMSRVRNIIKIISKIPLITFDDFVRFLNVVWGVGVCHQNTAVTRLITNT